MANIPVYNMTDTWNNSSCAFDAVRMDVTNTSSASSSRLLMLSATSGTPFIVDKYGCVNCMTIGCVYTPQNSALGKNALKCNTTGFQHTAIGYYALRDNTSGSANTAVGLRAVSRNTTGVHNTGIGVCSLACNTTGRLNVAIGSCSMLGNFGTSTGCKNTAVGVSSLRKFKTGCNNTAIGYNAASCTCTGCNNTAVGFDALKFNCVTGCLVAFGAYALRQNLTGTQNSAFGVNALRCNTTGSNNTASGFNAMSNNTTGFSNTATGGLTLSNNTTGNFNTAFGSQALSNNTGGSYNVGVGHNSLPFTTTGSCNTAVGYGTLKYGQGDKNVFVGFCAMGGFSFYTHCRNTIVGLAAGVSSSYGGGLCNTIQVGYCAATSSGCSNHTVWGNSSNNVCNCVYAAWSNVSDCRDKANIYDLPDKYGIDFVRKLKPVSYKYDHRDTYVKKCAYTYGKKDGSLKSDKCHYGFIAQDIKSTLDDLNITFEGLGYDKSKDAYRLTYEEMIAPIVKSIKQLIDRVELLENDNKLLNDRVKNFRTSLI